MKNACVVLVISVALTQGTADLHAVSLIPQENSANFKDGAGDPPQDQQHQAALVVDRSTNAGTTAGKPRANRNISSRSPARGHAGLMQASRTPQFRNERMRPRSANAGNTGQRSLSNSTSDADKRAANHGSPVPATHVAAPNGLPIRNARNRGMAPAIVGGPSAAPRNLPAINGTTMSRKR